MKRRKFTAFLSFLIILVTTGHCWASWKVNGVAAGKVSSVANIAAIGQSYPVWYASTNKSAADVITLPIALVSNAPAGGTTVTLTASPASHSSTKGIGQDYSLSVTSCTILEGAKTPATPVTLTVKNRAIIGIDKLVNITLSNEDGIQFAHHTMAVNIVDDIRTYLLDVTNPGQGLSACVGNGTTDNTTNLQAIYTWAAAHPGSVIYYPDGIYRFNYILYDLRSANLTSFGQSSSGTILKGTDSRTSGYPLITVTNANNRYTSGTYAGTVDSFNGNTVTDASVTFTGLVGKTVYNVTSGYASGTISAVTEHTFTAILTGGDRQDWQNSDTYHIRVDSLPFVFADMTLDGNSAAQSWTSEFAGLIYLTANGSYPGRANCYLDNVILKDPGGNNSQADGVYNLGQSNLYTYNTQGVNCGRGAITAVGGWTSMDIDTHIVNSGMVFQTEIGNHRYAAAAVLGNGDKMDITINNMQGAADLAFQMTIGNGSLSTTNITSSIFRGSFYFGYNGTTETINISDSEFYGTNLLSSVQQTMSFTYGFPQTLLIDGCTINGESGAATGTNYTGIYLATGYLANQNITISNTAIDCPAAVKNNFTNVAAIYRLGRENANEASSTMLIDTVTISNNFKNAYLSASAATGPGGTATIKDCVYNNLSYAFNIWGGIGDNRATLIVQGGTWSGMGGYLTSTSNNNGFNLTQTGVVIPEANCAILFKDNTFDAKMTFSGYKTIIGTKNPPVGVHACIGDYYQDDATTPTKQWICTTSGYKHGSTEVPAVWSQTIP